MCALTQSTVWKRSGSMKKYFYYVYSNGLPLSGGSLVEAEKLAKELRKYTTSRITIEKTPCWKRKGGWRA